MKKLFLSLIYLLALGFPARATDPLYHNIGTVNCGDAPQIDARVFINDGVFCGDTVPGGLFGDNFAIPYGTLNTLWFTNNGTMEAGRGFQLDNVTDNGFHHPAAGIFNNNGNSSSPATIVGSQYVLLSATNLVNRGILEVSSFGLMQLDGGNVNLSRSGIMVDPAGAGFAGGCIGSYRGLISPTNFQTFSGVIDDLYWGVGTITNLASDQIAQTLGGQLIAQSPTHTVTNLGGGFGINVGPIVDPSAFILTNLFVNGTNTNWIVQAVFVGNLDSNVTAQARFINNTYPNNTPPQNGFKTAAVQMQSFATNIVTGNPINYSLSIVDQLATDTNFVTLTNIFTGVTQRPAPYIVDIIPPCDFFLQSTPDNAAFTNTLLYDQNSYSNRVVTASYAGYAAGVFLATAPSPFPVILPTNSPGRVEITASNLDLSHTRIRGESIVSVKTTHLIGSGGLVVDAPNVNYNVGSTNGLLSLSGNDLANPEVQRFGGFIQLWSGLWTNFASLVVTNIGPDPNDPTMTVTNLATNQIEVDIHVLIVDAGGLTTVQPVSLNDFSASGTNIVLNDSISAGGSFGINGDTLTVNGTLNLASPIEWGATNVHLSILTNQGTINVPGVMELGNDARPYRAVVTTAGSSISANAVSLNADSFQNSGSVSASGLLAVKTRSGKFEGGKLSAGGDLSISGQDIKMTGHQQNSVALYLSVQNSLSDNGAGANNLLICEDGFNLLAKPNTGDLLGTTLRTVATQFRAADNTWAAEDRGLSPAGYSNNVAIGRLIIDPTDTSFLTFSGTGPKNALYVDFLELRGPARTSLQSVIAINSNLIIYFADANVTAETLDGLFADSLQPAGRLRWVSSFAGPGSSVDVLLLNGQTVKMNRALRFSQTIDSDGDGVPNAFDFYPLDAGVWNSVALTNTPFAPALALSWNAAPQSAYRVEFTTNLSLPNWRTLSGFTNLDYTNRIITILDTNLPPGASQRFYRMRYGP